MTHYEIVKEARRCVRMPAGSWVYSSSTCETHTILTRAVHTHRLKGHPPWARADYQGPSQLKEHWALNLLMWTWRRMMPRGLVT